MISFQSVETKAHVRKSTRSIDAAVVQYGTIELRAADHERYAVR